MTDDSGWEEAGYAMPPHALTPEPEVPGRREKWEKVPASPTLKEHWRPLKLGDQPTGEVMNVFSKNPIRPPYEVTPWDGTPAPRETRESESAVSGARDDKASERKAAQGARSAFSGDWPDGDAPASSGDAADFDPADVFNTMPPDIHLSHEGKQIVASLAPDMSGLGMTVSQIHEALRFASESANSEADEADDAAIFERFALHMSQHASMIRTQVDKVKVLADAYVQSEDYQDDMAVAECEAALAEIKSKMGSQEYIKDEQMQANYRTLVSVLAGEE